MDVLFIGFLDKEWDIVYVDLNLFLFLESKFVY